MLLLTESAESGDWETSYVGVVPEARRRGFGRELMLKALCQGARGRRRVADPVGGRPQPARLGPVSRPRLRAVSTEREVFLAVWK